MKLTQNRLIFLISLLFVLFYNFSFFSNTLKVYPLAFSNVGFLISLTIVLWAVIVFILELISYKKTTKPLLILLVIISSFTAYFMDSYGVIIDDGMLINAAQTNASESIGLLSFKLVLYFVSLGIIPAVLIYKTKIEYRGTKKELVSKMIAIIAALSIIGLSIFAFSGHYASFFREHKPLRQHTNPTFWMYSVGKFTASYFKPAKSLTQIGLDAKIKDHNRTKIVVMVVGEAARWDHFSLNGYGRDTNPLLKQEDIINLPNVSSCGTSTAYSVPCMFSAKTRKEFDLDNAPYEENALDVLNHTGKVAIIWRDNNSNSKDVATRIGEQDYRTNKFNTICTDGECRDEGMLVGLDKFIEQNKDKDVLIVLHQMGNHGPEYYKRYPKAFEKFTPTCKTNQLESCSKEQISNAFDNAILYTDTFLSKTINFLKNYDKDHDTTMIYMSDHGESLGENGVYLHGMPYMIAPEAQKHIGSILWFGNNTRKNIPYQKIVQNSKNEYSQDNLFHTLLGIFDVKTSVYDKSKDMINEN